MKQTISALAIAAALSGCYRTVVHAGSSTGGVEHTRTGWNVAWGLLDAELITSCPSGMSFNEVWHPWWGIFPEILTLGFVSPQRVTYVCTPTVEPAPTSPVTPEALPPPTVTSTP